MSPSPVTGPRRDEHQAREVRVEASRDTRLSSLDGVIREGVQSTFEPDPVIEAYKKDVDRSLIRENLRRTVQERLDSLVRALQVGEDLERAMKKATRS